MCICIHNYLYRKNQAWGWRDGVVVKSESTAPDENQSPVLNTYSRRLTTAVTPAPAGSNTSAFHEHWQS